MNNNENLSNKSTWYPGKRPARTLVNGVEFSFQSERGTFLEWIAPACERFGSLRRSALVRNADGVEVIWSLNMAGSVEIF